MPGRWFTDVWWNISKLICEAMFHANERRAGMTSAIFGLWRNWAVAVGLLTVLTILAPLVPREYLAPINILFYIILQFIHRELRSRDFPSCSRLIQQVSAVMLFTAIALVLLYFFGQGENMHEITGQPYDIHSPVIVILITAPVAAAVTMFYWINRNEPSVCRRCRARYGDVIEHGFVGSLYRQEWRYQTSMLFYLSLALTVVDWTYYMAHYVNTDLNRADLFFFVWMPLVMYVLSLIYLGMRYYYMWVYYCQNDEIHYVENPGTTTLRYLVISGDRIFLNFYPTPLEFANGAKVKRFDTPVVAQTEYHERESMLDAAKVFEARSGISDAEIKYAYSSPDEITFHNIFHYFAFLKSADEIVDSKLEGEWLSWGNVMQLAQQGLIARNLYTELQRIYKVAMAWKTYDADGRRLYNIKHYKPTFRLRDIQAWDVNFDDIKWLHVSRINEDRWFYPFRRLFTRKLNPRRG